MARIRTVKPEFWQHPKVTRVTRDARLLFLGLLNEADDAGRLRYGAKRLAGVLFGEDDDVGPVEVDRWTAELEREHLVQRYEVDGAPLLLVIGFTEHQKVNHPSPSRLPEPSCSPPVALPEDRAEVQETLSPEGNREQGMEQGKEQGSALALVSPSAPSPDPVIAIFQSWQEATGHHKAILDKKRKTRIVNARKHYPDEDLIDACRGVMLSPHNQGATNGQRYDDIALVLSDSAHIERFRDLYRGEGRPDARNHKLYGALAQVAAEAIDV